MFLPWATDVDAKFGIPMLVFHGTSFFLSVYNVFERTKEAEVRSCGVVVNSFYELKPAYANHYIKVLGRKAWHIGPVSLCNKEAEDRGQRGKESSIDKQECLKWFNTKNNDSVVYICFGNLANLTDSQPMKIAMGLEASEQQFIWVMKKGKDEKEEEDLGRAQS
ncbi:scopoletin glucosyltransferase-like [Carya illinoinensis]|uniref:scopoletin glucosyltransferase-like n=1 Tax=Carya illinoinensis TaxID=32201 RepID=UPI001C72578E|nr:scopoletin glucosyltransferase-like [Carya illinoinensis]